jgi:hypothetical protein
MRFFFCHVCPALSALPIVRHDGVFPIVNIEVLKKDRLTGSTTHCDTPLDGSTCLVLSPLPFLVTDTCNIYNSKWSYKLHAAHVRKPFCLKTSFCIITVSYIFVIPLFEVIPLGPINSKGHCSWMNPLFTSSWGLMFLIKLARRAFPGARHNAAGRAANGTGTAATLDRE